MDKEKTPAPLIIIAVLIIVGLVVDIVDFWVYGNYLSEQGIGFFSTVPWSTKWQYLKTFPGNLLTLLGLGPWIIILLYLYVVEKLDDIKLAKELEEVDKELDQLN